MSTPVWIYEATTTDKGEQTHAMQQSIHSLLRRARNDLDFAQIVFPKSSGYLREYVPFAHTQYRSKMECNSAKPLESSVLTFFRSILRKTVDFGVPFPVFNRRCFYVD